MIFNLIRDRYGLTRIGRIFFLAVLMCGCGKSEPPLSGGKPVSHWIKALKGPDPKQRKSAAFKVGNVGTTDATVLPALIEALKDADAGVRREAILALVKCVPEAKEAIPDLIELQEKDRDAKVRDYAAKALEKIKEVK